MSLVVDNPSQTPVHFSIQGADVTVILGPNAVQLDPVHRSLVNGAVQLNLGNLLPGSPFKVLTWQEKPAEQKGGKPEKKFQLETVVEVGRVFAAKEEGE